MAALAQLKRDLARTRKDLETAQNANRNAARRYLIAELLGVLNDRSRIAALTVGAEYEYDDEGGYFRYLTGSLMLAADDDVDDDYWTEGLDVEQAVILELFGIEDTGEGALTREQLAALAAKERIPVFAAGSAATLPVLPTEGAS